MPKRKRDDVEATGKFEVEDQALRIRISRLKAKVYQGHNSIASALKLTRGFERQKLGRRQKAAQNEPKELLRLREEVIVLKSLDLADTAKKYLFKQLAKTKRIRESPAFVTLYGEQPQLEAPKPGAEANVIGRLFKSNPLREVVPEVMRGIYRCLGIKERNPTTHAPRINQQAPRTDIESGDDVESSFEGFSGREPDPVPIPWLGEDDSREDEPPEDEKFSEFHDPIASSSDEINQEQIGEPSKRLPDRHILNGYNHDRQALSEPARLSAPISISDSQSPSQHPSSPTANSVQTKLSNTSFLPSLTIGGYYSGSESNDDEADRQYNTPTGIPQVRKNRRGQRARQQIAEKKYGKKAKHLAKPVSNGSKGRDEDWDAQRGATEGYRKKDRFGKIGRSSLQRKVEGPTGANADVVESRKQTTKSDRPLHPSWAAAKKRKEEQKPSLAFSGKKITFD